MTPLPDDGPAPHADHRPWPSGWVRAALEPAILGALLGGPLHGYGIGQVLAARGFGTLRGGSLYPVLARLEDAGHVTTHWVEGQSGPGRKDYELTDAGRAEYAEAVASFQALAAALAGLGDAVGDQADTADAVAGSAGAGAAASGTTAHTTGTTEEGTS
ncbi:PadR family transcriptional regulator [Micrococcus lylae]|uniref:PadR family transcriptional regulator n=1 Tax=Micrococcus lylae TaxID=1273 RepID=UPI000C7FB49E|nr:PadR family transcriptional regulator [Micrococcus lylae]MCT2008325.1 PadR family transcriptional regulator [Micrococcus lylae]MCT2072235.1 PadR family transcriptional regulator [Micrococcus lylae]WIK81551.1 PadR family transcriptional regulator [Micrococcus lylae]